MKKHLLFLFLLGAGSLFAQKAELLKSVDKEITEMQNFIRLSNTRIELKTAVDTKFNPKDNFNFESYAITNSVPRESLQHFFEKMRVGYTLYYPYTILSVKSNDSDLQKLLGKDSFYFMHDTAKEPVFTPKKLMLKDGTEKIIGEDYYTPERIATKHSKKVKEDGEEYEIVDTLRMNPLEKALYIERSSFYYRAGLENKKPLKAVQYTVTLPTDN